MLINKERLRLFFFCHSNIRSHPEAAGLQKHENVLLLLQHHPKEKGFHDTIFFPHAGSVGLVIPSMSHSQLLLISLTYLAHTRVAMSSHQGCVCTISGLFNTCMLHNLTTQGEERKGILDQSKIFCLS